MKVGIPRALLHYYYYPFFKTLFDELNIETIVSNPTTKEIMNKGIEHSVAEICVPMKVFSGHVAELVDEVDYIFIPRMISISKYEYFCPKFMGLPDMIRYTIPGVKEKIVSPKIDVADENIAKAKYYGEFKKKLGVKEKELQKALKIAYGKWNDFRNYSKEGHTLVEALDGFDQNHYEVSNTKNDEIITIGLLGYVYNIYDEYVSMNIIEKLKDLKIRVVTFEMLDEHALTKSLTDLKKVPFWTFSNKLLGAGYCFYEDENIDGIVHITAFGCGPDSMIGKILELDSDQYKKPFMTIRVDEHSGENHLQTRIEAFADMIKRKKINLGGGTVNENNISLYGNTACI
ncbi:hypothetical protein IZY60_02690 [Lutibacter sp. B2]|nr:hypothetical protein [Lutibacter sp. B2]